MIERDVASTPAQDGTQHAGATGTPITDLPPDPISTAPIASPPPGPAEQARSRWQARQELARHRAETERLRVLVDFLARPIHAHGGADPDPDIISAYNLAIEAALNAVRRAAQ